MPSIAPSNPSGFIPEVAPELVRYLETAFPLRAQATLDDYRRQEGARDVIEHLRAMCGEG